MGRRKHTYKNLDDEFEFALPVFAASISSEAGYAAERAPAGGDDAEAPSAEDVAGVGTGAVTGAGTGEEAGEGEGAV